MTLYSDHLLKKMLIIIVRIMLSNIQVTIGKKMTVFPLLIRMSPGSFPR